MNVFEPAMPDDIFDKRLTSPARAKLDLPFKPLQDSTKEFEIRELLSGSPLTDDRVLYVHLPFCIQNCSFYGYYKEINCHTGLIDHRGQ